MIMTKILRNIEVPTGNILIVRGENGKELECLSIGDYDKQANIKADFLGLSDEIISSLPSPETMMHTA